MGCGGGEPASGCERPILEGDWLRPFLAGAVAELAAAPRATTQEREDVPCRAADVAIALFDQEEVGLLGSRAFAATLDPARVRAVHTLDQIAWDADGDGGFELELPAPALEADWRAATAAVGARVQITSTSGTDHASFRARGLPAARLTEEYVDRDTSPFRHTPGDTPESIAPYLDYLALAARLAAYVVTEEVCALTSSCRSE